MDRALMIKFARQGFRRDAMGVPPYTLIGSKGRGMHSLRIEGNTQRTITIDGVEYVVPEGYTLLDYIESSGTQYIDTGINPAGKKIGAVIDFQFTSTSRTTGGIFGSNKTDGTDNCQFTVYNSRWRIKLNKYAAYGADYDTNRHTARCNMPDGTSLDGTVYTSTQYTIASGNTNNVFIGACNYGNGATNTYTLIGKLYPSRVYDDTTLVRAFHPAKNASNEAGMLDFVTGQFFPNAGTGTFIAGNELPTPDFPLGVKGVGDRTENLYCDDVSKWTKPCDYYVFPISLKQGQSYRFKAFRKVDNPLSNCVVAIVKSGRLYSEFVGMMPCVNYQGTLINVSFTADDTLTDPALAIYVPKGHTLQEVFDSYNIDFVKGTAYPTEHIPYGYKVTALLAQNCGCVDLGTIPTTGVSRLSKTAYGCSFQMFDMVDTVTNAYMTGYTLGTGDMTFRLVPVSGSVYVGIQDARFLSMTVGQISAFLSGKYLYFQRTTDASWVAPTPITIYTDKPLNKVGNYADVLDAIAGLKTDRVGVKVFDGTENWTYRGDYNRMYTAGLNGAMNNILNVACSHYIAKSTSSAIVHSGVNLSTSGDSVYIKDLNNITDLATGKAFLAAQYAAGTPVTVWYPLASETTGQVTGQSIVLPRGEVIVDSDNEVKAGRVGGTYQSQTT